MSRLLRQLSKGESSYAVVLIMAAAAAGRILHQRQQQQQQLEGHQKDESQKHHSTNRQTPSVKPRLFGPSSRWNPPSLFSVQHVCSCEQEQSVPRPNRSLQRYKTIRRLDLYSTKDSSLESKYLWDKKDVLGKGAYGSVYLAYVRSSMEPVALKEISKRHTDNRTFQREMRAMMHIRDAGGHPHVCGLRENFADEQYFYLIMDYVGGGEMFDHLERTWLAIWI